jgi:hypothetical protein
MEENDLKVSNYAAAFIDILGQRDSMKGCGLLPDNKEEFIKIAKKSVGVISQLHSSFDTFYKALTENTTNFQIPEEHREKFQHFQTTKLKFQRFSDGLVVFISLANDSTHSPVNGLYGLIASSGSLCLLGLASQNPIRGGADIAWGVELNESELYGCVIAKSYELESEVAKYPRIVLGNEIIDYLNSLIQNPENDINSQYGREMAKCCLEMICKAPDGVFMVDFLGEGFRRNIANTLDISVYSEALAYVKAQLELWRNKNNSELIERYEILFEYFMSRKSVWDA